MSHATPLISAEAYDSVLTLIVLWITLIACLYVGLRRPYLDWRRGRRLRLLRNNQRRFLSSSPDRFSVKHWP